MSLLTGLKVVDQSTTPPTVTTVTGPPFVDNIVVSTGLRGPAGVVVINSTDTYPPAGTPIGTIVYKRLT